MKPESSARLWIVFIGLISLLLGIFAAGRTAFNVYKFGDKYPQGGVLALNFSGQAPYYQRDSDCTIPPVPSYDANGKPMAPDASQAKTDAQTKMNCLAGVADTREQVKWNDIGTAALLVFVGMGILATRRMFFS